ncbi:MAG: hypothetical protein ACI88G_002294, partial [Woeseiaceae bacterium]
DGEQRLLDHLCIFECTKKRRGGSQKRSITT